VQPHSQNPDERSPMFLVCTVLAAVLLMTLTVAVLDS